MDTCAACGGHAADADLHNVCPGPERKPIALNSDRILVEPIEIETTVRGMERPGAAAERPKEGIVRWVGPGKVTEYGVRIEQAVAVGDLISFPDYAGKEIVDPRGFEPGAYLIVRQDEWLINYGPAANWMKPEETHE
jgi:chaperonin GroES